MAVVVVHVPGMRCRSCVRTATARVRDLPGVLAVEADQVSARLVVHGVVSEEQVRIALRDIEFPGGCRGECDGRGVP